MRAVNSSGTVTSVNDPPAGGGATSGATVPPAPAVPPVLVAAVPALPDGHVVDVQAPERTTKAATTEARMKVEERRSMAPVSAHQRIPAQTAGPCCTLAPLRGASECALRHTRR